VEHILTFLLRAAIAAGTIAENAGCLQITDVSIWIAGNENHGLTILQEVGANLKDMKREKQEIITMSKYEIC
jgi:hypothetical protein